MAAKLSIQLMMLVMLLFINQAFSKNTKKSVAKPRCQDSCGNLTISYPFGIGEKCSASKAMAMYCDDSFHPPKAFLRDKDSNNLEVLNISLEAGTISINYPITTDCTNTSNDLAHHQVRLALPLTFSNNDNRFTAMGCDNLALLSSTSEDSSQLEAGGCLSRCNPSLKKDNSCFGINCCQTKFPQSLTFVKPSLSNGSISSSGCSDGPRYAFIVDQKWFAKLKDIYIVQTMETVPAVLNWKPFGACQTFIELDPIKNATLCKENAFCTNQSLCSCREGYEGNPYLRDGCQDIDECASDIPGSRASPPLKQPRGPPKAPLPKRAPKTLYMYDFKKSPPKSLPPALPGSSLKLNRCDHYCTNTPGSYNCSCKDGWVLVDKFKCVKSEVIYRVTKEEVDPRGKKGKKGEIIVTTVTCAGIGVILIVTWYLYKEARRRYIRKLGVKLFKRNGGLLLQQLLSSSQENEETTKLFTSKELEMATDHYNEDRIVGQGGNRTVYKGMLTDGRIVAVKKSKIQDKSKIKQFINEVVTLSQINHRNIVKLHGCCLETEVPLLVYEFIPNGTLMQYIHEDNEYFPLTWDVRLRVATEVAGALCYLHSAASIPIYHRDIKSTNILLDDKYRAKVADFGISAAVSIDQKVADFGSSTSFSTDQKLADFGTSTSVSTDQKLADFGSLTSFSTDQKVPDFGSSTSFSTDQKLADFGTSKSVSTDQKLADFGTLTSFSTDQKVADFGTSTSFSNDQKVADFGTSTSFSNDRTRLTTRLQGTFGYLDPEYFRSRQFTDKSDVYSFGVVLVELLTGQKPILAARLEDKARSLATLFILAMEETRILDIIDSRIINEGKKEEMIAFADIAYRCLNLNGRKRPTMKQVVAELESIRNTPESPTAQENYEEVENEKHELNATLESEVTSSSLGSTINNILSF